MDNSKKLFGHIMKVQTLPWEAYLYISVLMWLTRSNHNGYFAYYVAVGVQHEIGKYQRNVEDTYPGEPTPAQELEAIQLRLDAIHQLEQGRKDISSRNLHKSKVGELLQK